ncbi:hypothetical protein ACS0TY_022765 [Phlomoides rotata]
MSHYLFLFCVEALSSLIRKKVEKRVLHGVRICHRAPVVSNLFFVDDTLIFSRATQTELIGAKHILKIYEEALGQTINLNKSDLMFSSGIFEERGVSLAALLGVRRVEQHSIYLGIPIIVERSHGAVFRSLVGKVLKKLKDWKSKTLSQVRKLALVKSVVQSIPTYLMACFKLPQSIIEDY